MLHFRSLFLCMLCLATTLSAGSRAFIHIEGVEGDSDESMHQGWFEILSYSYEKSYWDRKLDQPSAIDFGDSARAGSEILITREQSKAIQELFDNASNGGILPDIKLAVFTGERNSNNRCQMIVYRMKKPWVNMLRVDRKSRSRNSPPIETISLGFERMFWESSVPEPTPCYPTEIHRWH